MPLKSSPWLNRGLALLRQMSLTYYFNMMDSS
jgi:hypothetical protein